MTTMYQALYRKYRPRTFDDVVGQEHITSTLKRQVQTGRLSHAYLFSGTRGTGKTTCARILARAVNCEHPVDGNPCNQCASCRGILDESILDVVELDAASHNGVDDIRALRDEAVYSPAAVKKRVYIIDEAHALATSSMAFNALLKILEEPPEHVIFILCTTAPQKIVPTIVSRCQRHTFTRIDRPAIAARLAYVAEREGMDLTPEAAELLAQMADGGMRDALSLLDQCAASEHIDEAAVLSAMGLAGSRRTGELLDAILARDAAGALTLFDRLWMDGKEPAGILDELAGLMRDTLMLQVAPQGGEALLSGLYDTGTLRRFADAFSGARLMDGLNAIRAADVAGANPRRAAELCLVELCAPEMGSSLAGLKNRVAALEEALKKGVSLPPAASAAEVPAAEAPAPAKTPAPPVEETAPSVEVPAPPVEEDDFPFTDEDAPPEDPYGQFMEPPAPLPEAPPIPEEPAPAGPVPAEEPAPGPESEDSKAVWDAMVRKVQGQLDMGAYAMLLSPTQVTGVYSGSTMTVRLATPIAKRMLDSPLVAAALQKALQDVTGHAVTVTFTDRDTDPPAKPDIQKLDALSRFPNFKFEE